MSMRGNEKRKRGPERKGTADGRKRRKRRRESQQERKRYEGGIERIGKREAT